MALNSIHNSEGAVMASPPVADARISLASPLLWEPRADKCDPPNDHSPAVGAEWDRIVDALSRLRHLNDDWDGQGSLAINSANLDQAMCWVKEMRCWQRALA